MTHSLHAVADSTTRASQRSEEADALPKKLPPAPLTPPLKQPALSLSKDKRAVWAPHYLLPNDGCVAVAVGIDVAPGNSGLWRLHE